MKADFAKTVLVAMSGGVDSSVAALLLKEQGYICTGVTMKLFNNETIGLSPFEGKCCGLDDIADASSVCRRIGIEHFTFNFGEHFQHEVIDRFIADYEQGRTPNPCIDCNRYLKFNRLFTQAQELGCSYLATGHYARVEYDAGRRRFLLRKAVDSLKDQSYVLYSLTQAQLAHVLFPLGRLTKNAVRQLAEQYGFVNAQKQDSQDICFVSNGYYTDFIEQYTGKKYPPGDFVDTNGEILGRHKGIIHYTVGQRKGLGLALPQPMYVKELDVEHNNVILTTDAGLYSKKFLVRQINLIDCDAIEGQRRLKVRIRYHQPEQTATVRQLDTDTLQIEFDEAVRAVTKGQAAVMYDGDMVVGGGTII